MTGIPPLQDAASRSSRGTARPAQRGRDPAVPGPTDRPRTIDLSVPQRVVARRMEQSKQTIPHFYLQTSANAEAMAARRKAGAGEPIAWDAFFVHAAGKALRRFERLTFRFAEDRLVSQEVDTVGLAVDLQGDLFTLAIDHPADKAARGDLPGDRRQAWRGSARAIPGPGWRGRPL